MALTGHNWDTSALPTADGIKYTYAAQNHEQVKDLYAIPKILKKAIKKKDYTQCFSFKKEMKEEDLPNADALVEQMNMALSLSGRDMMSMAGSWYESENDGYILGIFITDYSDTESSSNSQVSEKVSEKLKDEISKLFDVDLESSEGMYVDEEDI